jgi:beta-mannanase
MSACIKRILRAAVVPCALMVALGQPEALGATLDPGSGGGVYFGAYVNLTNKWTQTDRMAEITRYESDLGRKLAINHRYYGWTSELADWETRWDVANGRIPLLSWSHYSATAVTSGSQDAVIRTAADHLRALGKPVMLEWFWEMDLNRYANQTGSPATFIAAWRHIHDIFVHEGAANVAFVWCPTANGFATGAAQRYYPGNSYVNWICADGYNWGGVRSTRPWRSFSEIFSSFYHWGTTATSKPLMVGEVGTGEGTVGQKATWFDNAASSLPTIFPRIAAVVYFDSYDSANNWDWKSTSSTSARTAYISWARTRYDRLGS